jgi:dTDP-4-dehydrorhamnose 3,5-epimerase
MNRFTVYDTKIADLKIIERQQLGDSRGFLSRLFCCEELSSAGWGNTVAQVNYTYTKKKGTIKGLHFQLPPHSEKKLISCLRGAVWDVAVDLRVGSPSFLKWHAEELSEGNQRALLIPEGFAHGFQALSNDCELIYLHSRKHAPNAEAGINVSDLALSIDWPLAFSEISARDAQLPMADLNFDGIKI